MPVKPIPDGYHSITPYIVMQNASGFIEFAKTAFDATVKERMETPDGGISHAEIRIGDSIIMLSDPLRDPILRPGYMYLYVPDTDATYKNAIAAGAESLMVPSDQSYGDRNAGVKDQFGNTWWIATHVEDVSPEEMARRAEAALAPK